MPNANVSVMSVLTRHGRLTMLRAVHLRLMYGYCIIVNTVEMPVQDGLLS
jgi:hypothetical protein